MFIRRVFSFVRRLRCFSYTLHFWILTFELEERKYENYPHYELGYRAHVSDLVHEDCYWEDYIDTYPWFIMVGWAY